MHSKDLRLELKSANIIEVVHKIKTGASAHCIEWGQAVSQLHTKAQKFVPRSAVAHLALAALLYFLPVLVFIELAESIWEHEPMGWDQRILEWLYSIATPALDQLAILITHAGGAVSIAILTAIGAAGLIWTQRRQAAAALILGVSGALGLNQVLKGIFQRERPTLWEQVIEQGGYSFPSGHAMMSSALALSLIVIAWNTRLRGPVIIVGGTYAVLVGLSRMYLGVHFPTDVLAGWCVSLVWVLLVSHILKRPTTIPLRHHN